MWLGHGSEHRVKWHHLWSRHQQSDQLLTVSMTDLTFPHDIVMTWSRLDPQWWLERPRTFRT